MLTKTQGTDLMQALGAQLVSMAQRSFGDESLRPAGWPARKSGELWRSLRVISTGTGTVSVGSHVVYAAIHQFGGTTKPHVILPKNGKALAFMTKGHQFFGVASLAKKMVLKKVNHPGSQIPARPYFPIMPGTSQLSTEAEQRLQALVRKYLTGS